MSEWISKAVNVFKKKDIPETPQPFEVICECGQKHSGVRRVRYQHLICKACGDSLFVLPRNTYPPPHELRTSPAKKKQESSPAPEFSPVPLDFSDPEIGLRPPESKPKKSNGSPQVVPKEVYEEEPGPGFLRRKMTDGVLFIIAMKDGFFEFWTPHRKLALVIVGLLAATAFYSYRQSVLRSAATIAREKLDVGLAFIEEQSWIDAKLEFEQATKAVDELGRTDQEANEIRQYAREITTLSELSDATFFEIVEMAEATYTDQGRERWQAKFSSSYQDQWFIIEGVLKPTMLYPSETGKPRLQLVFPWVVGTRPREVAVIADFPLATHLPPLTTTSYEESSGTYAIFAGQLKSCRLGQNSEWVVELDPQSAFFWVHGETYLPTHLREGSTISKTDYRQILDQQAKWMGVKE